MNCNNLRKYSSSSQKLIMKLYFFINYIHALIYKYKSLAKSMEAFQVNQLAIENLKERVSHILLFLLWVWYILYISNIFSTLNTRFFIKLFVKHLLSTLGKSSPNCFTFFLMSDLCLRAPIYMSIFPIIMLTYLMF